MRTYEHPQLDQVNVRGFWNQLNDANLNYDVVRGGLVVGS